MATTRKTGKAGNRRASAGAHADAQAEAERLSRSLSESAQQIWLAGVGAFGRAQAEGTKLFEGLVREGQNLERTARRFADGRADLVREAVEARVDQARERATGTWERLEHAFEERVHGAMVKLGVPVREDFHDLSRRVDALTAELRRRAGDTPAPRARPSKQPAGKTASRKTPARKPAVAKATAKRPARKTPAAAKPGARKPRAPGGRRAP